MVAPHLPRPHQAAAIEAVAGHFANESDGDVRAQVTMMCGTGKTLTAQRLVERLVADGQIPATGRVLMLFPSLALVQQTFDAWIEQAVPGHPIRALAFCSGAARRTGWEDIDETALPMERTTDPARLAEWLVDPHSAGLSVVFGTYQSSPNIATAHGAHGLDAWDLVIADEAHNTAGDLASPFATVLLGDRIRARRRLFMTATPRVHIKRGRKVATASDLGIASMDDESVYGPRVYNYSMPRAVADGVLNDYEVVILGVTDSEVRTFIERHPIVLSDVDAQASRDEVLAAIALLKASKAFGLARVLTFHNTIRRAERFAASLPRIASALSKSELHSGSISALAVKGTDPTEHRQSVLDALAATPNSGFTSVSNCRVFAEGIDAPTLDGELIADARTNPVEVTQIVGRVIRLNKKRAGKSIIVIPVLDDESLDPTIRLASSSFDKVWQTILALSEHDVEMQADLDRLRDRSASVPAEPIDQGVEVEPAGPGGGSILDEVPEWQPADVENSERPLSKVDLRLSVPRYGAAQLMQAFEVRVVDRCVDPWDTHLASLSAFVRTNGRFPRQSTRDRAERLLARWLNSQRTQDNAGRLPDQRRFALAEALDLDWNPNKGRTPDARWAERLEEVSVFVQEHNRLPKGTEAGHADERSLSAWLGAQRRQDKDGVLPPQRRSALVEALGPSWNPNRDRTSDSQWEERLQQLAAFVDETGRPPRGSVKADSERRIGTWLETQAKQDENRRLASSRASALEAVLGPEWNRHKAWRTRLLSVETFVEQHGRSPEPNAPDPDERELASWLARHGSATSSKRSMLEPLLGEFWWAKYREAAA